MMIALAVLGGVLLGIGLVVALLWGAASAAVAGALW